VASSGGEKLWNFSIPYTVSSKPPVENGTVFIGGNFVTTRSPDFESTGAIVGLKPAITSMPLGSPPVSTPTPETPSPTPNSSVPEFPTGIALSFLVATALTALCYSKKRKSKSG
jgi:hypothetical protein